MTTRSTTPSSSSSPARDQREDLLKRLDKALIGSSDLVPLDDARYLETHRIYEGRSDQQQRIIDWFGDQIAPTSQPDRPFRVLSVGCGSGILDVAIATRLAEQTDDLHYVGIDPNKVECEAFQQLFSDASLDRVEVEVVPATFEDFEATCSFDLIHIVHSLYYMPDPAGALERARKLLAPGGRLVVFHAPCEALNDLTVRFWDKQYERPTLFAEDFAQTLDAWSWDYERTRVDARLEVTPMAQADSSIGLALRDFIVQYDSRHLPEPVQDLVERYLRLISTEHRGETHIPHPVDVFVIGA
jgi:SAM-dependent methyltransferase